MSLIFLLSISVLMKSNFHYNHLTGTSSNNLKLMNLFFYNFMFKLCGY